MKGSTCKEEVECNVHKSIKDRNVEDNLEDHVKSLTNDLVELLSEVKTLQESTNDKAEDVLLDRIKKEAVENFKRRIDMRGSLFESDDDGDDEEEFFIPSSDPGTMPGLKVRALAKINHILMIIISGLNHWGCWCRKEFHSPTINKTKAEFGLN